MDIKFQIKKIIENGSQATDWLYFVDQVKSKCDRDILESIYIAALNNISQNKSKAYKKLLVGFANLQSNIAPENARKTFINANSLDIDCAVVCVYYAQFEYRHNKDNARTIIVKGKCDGRTPKILLTQAYRNIKNNIANLFDGITDPWDEALCDVTDTGTFTNSKTVSPEKPENHVLHSSKSLSSFPARSLPVRSVNKTRSTSALIKGTNSPCENFRRQDQSNLCSGDNQQKKSHGPSLSPFLEKDSSKLFEFQSSTAKIIESTPHDLFNCNRSRENIVFETPKHFDFLSKKNNVDLEYANQTERLRLSTVFENQTSLNSQTQDCKTPAPNQNKENDIVSVPNKVASNDHSVRNKSFMRRSIASSGLVCNNNNEQALKKRIPTDEFLYASHSQEEVKEVSDLSGNVFKDDSIRLLDSKNENNIEPVENVVNSNNRKRIPLSVLCDNSCNNDKVSMSSTFQNISIKPPDCSSLVKKELSGHIEQNILVESQFKNESTLKSENNLDHAKLKIQTEENLFEKICNLSLNPSPQIRTLTEGGLNETKNTCINPNERSKDFFVNGRCYKRVSFIGKGGSCKVFEVFSSTGETYALKRVHLEELDTCMLDLYLSEIKWLEKLKDNPYIIRIFDWEKTNDSLLIVMEKGDRDLASILRTVKVLPIEKLKDFWRQMLSAVLAIHNMGVVHADLKPANFLLVGEKLKLIDFGIANGIQANKTSITRECVMGTLNYMPPEALNPDINHANGASKISRESDVWSLGCILYMMIFKKTPYQHIRNQNAKMLAIQRGDEIDFSGIRDKNLLHCLKVCLKYDKHERQSVDQLLQHPFLQS